MNTVDPMVSALISLCKAEGGEKFVADKALVSAENLLQITKGVKLPSGNPRGVGPGLRAKITRAYPEWLSRHANKENSTLAPIDKEPVAINNIATSLRVLADAMSKLTDGQRRLLSPMLAQLPMSPELHSDITEALLGWLGTANASSAVATPPESYRFAGR